MHTRELRLTFAKSRAAATGPHTHTRRRLEVRAGVTGSEKVSRLTVCVHIVCTVLRAVERLRQAVMGWGDELCVYANR